MATTVEFYFIIQTCTMPYFNDFTHSHTRQISLGHTYYHNLHKIDQFWHHGFTIAIGQLCTLCIVQTFRMFINALFFQKGVHQFEWFFHNERIIIFDENIVADRV